MNSFFYMMTFVLVGCGFAAQNHDSQVADTQTASGNLLECDENITNCKLIRATASGSSRVKKLVSKKSIEMAWKVNVTSTCTMGDQPVDSQIYLDVGGNRKRLTFGENLSYTVNSPGPIKIVDDQWRLTASQYFDDSCALKVATSHTPSASQIQIWKEKTNSIVKTLDQNREIYAQQSTVSLWFAKYIQDSQTNRSEIQGIIADLAHESDPWLVELRSSLKAIIADKPAAIIFAPYALAKSNIDEELTIARTHLQTLRQWNQATAEALDDAISAAEDEL